MTALTPLRPTCQHPTVVHSVDHIDSRSGLLEQLRHVPYMVSRLVNSVRLCLCQFGIQKHGPLAAAKVTTTRCFEPTKGQPSSQNGADYFLKVQLESATLYRLQHAQNRQAKLHPHTSSNPFRCERPTLLARSSTRRACLCGN